MIQRKKIILSGQVQGVGCRPFIYRIATDLSLTGFVRNDTQGVTINVQGDESAVAKFIDTLQSPDPSAPLLRIQTCTVEDIPVIDNEASFTIQHSDSAGSPTSQVTFDTAACADCLREMDDPNDFRYRYPFINCTNCGPRYSIIKTIPYDRCNTTMGVFDMCDKCSAQYTAVTDRRFHAQPVACKTCGPKIWLTDCNGTTIETDSDLTISKAAELLKGGSILAVKGLGGFHLAVDASNADAVTLLRKRKRRDSKPLALMAASIEKIEEYCFVSETQKRLLQSPQSPIVLLKTKPDAHITPGIADGLNTLGFMLCYAPLHHMLFDEPGIDVLVMTSANISDEPLICDNDIAVMQLFNIVDAFIMHDRDIYRQVDDSIVHIIDDAPALLRRSRGYVPNAILTDTPIAKDIFAAGADLKNTFCFAKHDRFILSEHIGDLDSAKTYRHYVNSIKHLKQLFEVAPKVIACDLHPGYMSTQFAHNIVKQKGLELIQVQHHWAHIAAVLAEFNHPEPVIGLVADGTGYGTDGAVWGGECLIASLEKFERFGHLKYFDLAGGDAASREAIRPLAGLLKGLKEGTEGEIDGSVMPENKCENRDDLCEVLRKYEKNCEKVTTLCAQLKSGLNLQKSSSFGRFFDGISAFLAIGSTNFYEAQLPMMLESIAIENVHNTYEVGFITENSGPIQMDWRTILAGIIDDVNNKTDVGIISAKFHNSIADGMLHWAKLARDANNINTVALAGGVFCNRYLTNRLIRLLKNHDFSVLFTKSVPANDGAIAVGQAAITARKFCK